MIASSLTCGYLDPGASYLLVRVDSRGLITGSYFQQVTPCLELGVVSMPNSEDGPKMDIATKFALSPQVLTLRGKVNNRSELGVGCDFQVVKGMTLSFSSAIDLKTFNSGSHKFGIGLAFAHVRNFFSSGGKNRFEPHPESIHHRSALFTPNGETRRLFFHGILLDRGENPCLAFLGWKVEEEGRTRCNITNRTDTPVFSLRLTLRIVRNSEIRSTERSQSAERRKEKKSAAVHITSLTGKQ
ncbi:Voltage-dependent anion-selective channel [Folsomia candida]|uniref:Voltage-dependent anion-selective channel n=1 Tax=Folsomia candida TaxID=158441 RepID=A0A226EM07_FOLCA|nr:Voltage-dependent anion-selective channel [Folsomia candida]